jgi:hypothetical protein
LEKERLRFLQISEKRLERFERLERLERASVLGELKKGNKKNFSLERFLALEDSLQIAAMRLLLI